MPTKRPARKPPTFRAPSTESVSSTTEAEMDLDTPNASTSALFADPPSTSASASEIFTIGTPPFPSSAREMPYNAPTATDHPPPTTPFLRGGGAGASNIPTSPAPSYLNHPPFSNPPLRTGEIPIPAHQHASAYLPSLLPTLRTTAALPHAPEQHLSHLNCSFFSHPTASSGPTLLQLKKHAQGLCLLIQLLVAGDVEEVEEGGEGVDAFDFLDDLYTPYVNAGRSHHLPLRSLRNTLAEYTDAASGERRRLVGCPLAQERPDLEARVRVVEHASAVLEFVDHLYSAQGGLFAIVPPAEDVEARERVRETFLGQWLLYMTGLVGRVGELERELGGLRECLAGEAVVPGARRGMVGVDGGRELVWPQDRYVLCGLTEGLWGRLGEELGVREREIEKREAGWREKLGAAEEEDEGRVCAWIEVTSRIWRVQGLETMFVVPAWDVRPGGEAARRLEEKGTVQTVVGRSVAGGTAWERGEQRRVGEWAARFEECGDELERLRGEVAGLRRELRVAREEGRRWRLVVEGRESEDGVIVKEV